MEEFNGGGRIKPLINLQWMEEFNGGGKNWDNSALLKIFNECKNLKGGGRIKPLNIFWRIFNECRSLTGVGEFIWDV